MYAKYSKLTSTKQGSVLVLLLEVLVAYIIASLAIETGNLGYYVLFATLLVDILRRFINLFKNVKIPKPKRSS